MFPIWLIQVQVAKRYQKVFPYMLALAMSFQKYFFRLCIEVFTMKTCRLVVALVMSETKRLTIE